MEARRQAAGPQWIDIDTADAENPMACTDYVGSIMEHLFQSEVRSALLSYFGALGIKQRLACFAPPSRSAHTMIMHWYVCSRDDFRRSYRLAVPAGCDINAGLQHAT